MRRQSARDRVCAACARNYGREGPLPYACDWHLVDGAMLMTCSPACREKLGLPERKPRSADATST